MNTIIFDLDGTLLNTLDDLADALNHALEVFGYPKCTLKQVKGFVGNGVKKLVERALPPDLKQEKKNELYQVFWDYYSKNCANKTKPYEGILELLIQLKERGIKLAIVSNKMDSAVQELRRLYFDGIVDVAVGVGDGVSTKPDPTGTLRAMERLGSTSKETIFVGDSEVDIETAGRAGLECISVLWGFKEKDFLIENGAVKLIERPEEILNYL
ncbi:MAG: HAD-IA family hydrolase [Lachnospiraceae bacterium]